MTAEPLPVLERRRKHFALEYVRNGFNGTRAAIAAGYSKKGADVAASRLLGNSGVMAHVEAEQAKHFERLAMSAREVIARASVIARADFADLLDEDGNLLPLDRIPATTRLALESVKTDIWLGKEEDVGLATRTIKFASKTAALQLLAKYHGLVRDREPEAPPPVQRAMGEVELARSIAFALMRADAETVEPT